MASELIRLNVGGRIFEDSMLAALVKEEWKIPPGEEGAGEYFIDRDPVCFSVLLHLLRSGELHINPDVPDKQLYCEAKFYGLLDHVRAAWWGPFEGNNLHLSASIKCRAPPNATAIRASPDGGFCVIHDRLIHVYDWMFQEDPPINLDYQRICDAAYIDSSNILVSAYGCRDHAKRGIGLFSSISGDLCHRFNVSHNGKMLNPGALCLSDSQPIVFAICKSKYDGNGIGVWDQITGNLSDFFYEPMGLTDANKLQWIKGDGFLLVASVHPANDKSFIGIVDFRERKSVWAWTNERPKTEDKRVSDAIMMEDNRSICIVNRREEFGFLDLRSNRELVQWSTGREPMSSSNVMDTSYPKLATNGGQLFLSMKDTISVFSGPEWVLTSKLGRSAGSYISDMSIGGDRLFALHEDVINVWESPTLSNLQFSRALH